MVTFWVAAEGLRAERAQSGESQRGSQGTEDETAAVHFKDRVAGGVINSSCPGISKRAFPWWVGSAFEGGGSVPFTDSNPLRKFHGGTSSAQLSKGPEVLDIPDHHLVHRLASPFDQLGRVGVGLVAGAVIEDRRDLDGAALRDELRLLVVVTELPVEIVAGDVQ